MPPKRRKFSRPLGERRYRKIFILAVEGIKTEPQYFAVFNDQNSVIRVNCLKGKHDSSPPQVLARMENHLKKEGLKKSDEAWLVVDKDQWTDDNCHSCINGPSRLIIMDLHSVIPNLNSGSFCISRMAVA